MQRELPFFSVAKYLTIFFLPHRHFRILSLSLFLIWLPLFLTHILYVIQQSLCIVALLTILVKFFICVSFKDKIKLASSSIVFSLSHRHRPHSNFPIFFRFPYTTFFTSNIQSASTRAFFIVALHTFSFLAYFLLL